MRTLIASLLPCLAAGLSASAQQQPPAVRLINAADAASPHTFTQVLGVRALPGGGLLVNDAGNRQLVLLGPTLAPGVVVADSASGTPNSYGVRAGALIPYVGDSSLFVDPAGLSMFVISPAGTIARVASVPRSQDAVWIGSQVQNSPAVDAAGRLVYRGAPARLMPLRQEKGPPQVPDSPDSVALVRVDLATRKLDTAAFYKIPKIKMNITQTERGFMALSEVNPLPIVDDWAVMSDGSVAIVRGQDYHVDFVNADGSVTAAPKIPFDWQKLSDDDKTAVLDSAKAAIEKARADAASGARGAASGAAVERQGMIVIGMAGGASRSTGSAPALPPVAMVGASELPDYRPAFGINAVRADLDDNVWIRTSATRPGAVAAGPIYDVVNRKGELVDRVEVPAGRQIIGFAKGGVVYLLAREGAQSWIERTHR